MNKTAGTARGERYPRSKEEAGQDTAADLIQRILRAENLPSPPALALRVLQLLNAEDTAMRKIAGVVSHDPGMTGRLLKLVNSPLYTRGHKIGSVEQAMVLLGLRAVKVSLLGFSLTAALRQQDHEGFDYPDYWRSSVCMAVAARMFAKHLTPGQPEDAFVAGLLADVGQVAAHRTVPQVYGPVLSEARQSDRPLHEIEAGQLGVAHDEVSGRLLERWGLPAHISDAVAGHHQPLNGEPPPPALSVVLRLAAITTACLTDPKAAVTTPETEALLARRLGLSEQQTEELLSAVLDHVPTTADAFGLKIADVASYAQLQMEAAAKIAQLGLMAEAECSQAQNQAAQAGRRLGRMQQENQMLRRDASINKLTGIANRAAFDQHLQQTWNECHADGTPLAIVLLDIDRFKQFNDTYGHQVGDEVLRRVGQVLGQAGSETCLPARYGGEEFALVIRSAQPGEVDQLAERVRQRIEYLQIEHQGQPITVTVSVGVACTNGGEPVGGALDLVGLADQRLYEAKRTGRNRVVGCVEPRP